MESGPHDNLNKRSLDLIELFSDDETVEKRAKLEDSDSVREVIMISGNSETDREQAESPTEVIYQLSPDNEELLSSVQDMKSPSKEGSPIKLEEIEGSDKDEEVKNKRESVEEESDKSDEKSEEDIEESSESEDSDEDSDNQNEEDDSSDSEDVQDNKGNERFDEVTNKLIVENLSEHESDDNAVEQKEDTKRNVEKSEITEHPSKMEVDGNAGNERHLTDSSKDEDGHKISEKEKKKEDGVDGGGSYVKSDDYSKKSVEDLEDLQEDIHKELAQITGKTIPRRKHKKASSSSHREKRHKEKRSSSRHKEKSSRSRESSRKDYEKRHKHHDQYDIEEKWSHNARRPDSKNSERRDRGEKVERSWMQTRPERSPPNRTVAKNPHWVAGMETRAPKAEQTSWGTEPSGDVKETAKEGQKGFISDSMRERIRASMKERNPNQMKDLRGLSREVIDSESDDSAREYVAVEKNMSDVSPASSSAGEVDVRKSSPKVPKLPPYLPAIHGCRNVEEFHWLNRIEEGTYGVVYRAKDKRTGEIVALKKLKMEKEKEGFPITSLREINTLLKAQHPNIVTVQEIVVGNNMDKIYIVMDFVEHDLKALMETMTQSFLGGEIKTIMIQLLRAVNHLHDNWILHRDIKTSNLLLSNKGILKVGDFGLAREYGSPLKPYTPVVVTLWYRAPELLLGAKEYSTPIDLWSIGCVFAELLTMKPLFNGQSEISQINKIFKELGTPSDKIWPGPPAYSEFPATKKMTFADYPYNNLRNRFGATLTDKGFDLLNSFLTYDPNRRITAEVALKHEYFKESPIPVDPSMFPSWPARSEGAKRTKKASPKAPEGGNFYKTLSGDGDGTGGFHIPVGKAKGAAAVPSFTLKF